MYIDAVILFIFGTIGGSFLNALAFRHNTGKSMWGRSACTSCGKVLRASDLVPVLSYIFLRGRCAACKTSISLQYPTVESIGGILAVLCYGQTATPVEFVLSFGFFMLLLFIAVYDLRHTIIPDQFVYAAMFVALLSHGGLESGVISLPSKDIFFGALLAVPLALMWLVSKGRAMGLGDAKLMIAIGVFLGFSSGLAALVLSFWIGAVVGLLLLFLSSKRTGTRVTMKSEVPFGPFLALGCAIAYFCHVTIDSLVLFF